jgi:hypothetical protein
MKRIKEFEKEYIIREVCSEPTLYVYSRRKRAIYRIEAKTRDIYKSNKDSLLHYSYANVKIEVKNLNVSEQDFREKFKYYVGLSDNGPEYDDILHLLIEEDEKL